MMIHRWESATLVLVACLVGCREANEFVAPPPPKVTVAKPLLQEIVTFREFSGRTEAIESVTVRARVEGFLKSIEFEEGAEVEKGALLYTIEPEQYEAAVLAAKANLEGNKAELHRATAEFDRMERLKEQDAAARMEYVDSEANLQRAKAAVMSSEAALQRAEIDLSYTKVTAPLAGMVNRTRVYVGNLVGAGEATVLTTIVPWDPINAYVTVDERSVLSFRRRVSETDEVVPRIPVYLRLADGHVYADAGVIDYVDNQIDPQTGTLEIRALFPNKQRILVPGTFGRVRVPRPAHDAVLVPEDALQRDLSGYYLMTVDASNTVARANVTPGDKIDVMREIESGLEGNERVITMGLQRVRPGITVNVEETELEPVEVPSVSPADPASTVDPEAQED